MKYNKEKAAEYYQRNKEKIKAKRKLARLSESPEKRKKRLAFHRAYNSDPRNVETRKTLQKSDKYKYSYGYKYPSKKRGYDFNLTFEQFTELIHSDCYLCGSPEAGGVDRIDNSVGYQIENSKPCCEMCNKLKWAHNLNDFLQHIEKIYRHNRVV